MKTLNMTNDEINMIIDFIVSKDKQLTDYFIELGDTVKTKRGSYQDTWFTVSREKATGTYYLVLLKNDKKHLAKAHREFKKFMKELYYKDEMGNMVKGAIKNVKPITLANIYDFEGGLTSSDYSLEDLYAKFDFIYKAFKN